MVNGKYLQTAHLGTSLGHEHRLGRHIVTRGTLGDVPDRPDVIYDQLSNELPAQQKPATLPGITTPRMRTQS